LYYPGRLSCLNSLSQQRGANHTPHCEVIEIKGVLRLEDVIGKTEALNRVRTHFDRADSRQQRRRISSFFAPPSEQGGTDVKIADFLS
jgi:hypothetical protein